MDKYVILGGARLEGEVEISGAKNSAVALIAAAIMVKGVCVIDNVPLVSDIYVLVDIINKLGGKAFFTGKGILTIDCTELSCYEAPYEMVGKIRASSYLMGALLGRFNNARVSMPGGCDFGVRPIDLHLKGFVALGAEYSVEHGLVDISAEYLHGAEIYMDQVSVGATINVMLAASLADGLTIIENAAKEPHIVDVANFLNSMGANIKGAGTDTIKIKGVEELHGGSYTVIPDQIEAGTFMVAAAATRGDVTLTNVRPEHLTAVLAALERAGCTLTQQNGMLRLRCSRLRAAGPIRTAPYDGFPTDAQAPLMAAMAVAEGVTVFEENLFEDRFRHVPALRALGAHIHAARRYAVVTGVRELHGASMTATDLRGGAAMVIGALCARGESELAGTAHLKRGYAELVPTLRACGADITER